MTRVYLSIGSNIEREHNVRSAVSELEKLFSPLTLSSVYLSRAVGFEGEDFYNMVVGFNSTLSLNDIRDRLRRIEGAHGRKRGMEKFSARPLDIDLLLFGDTVQHDMGFDIPRREIEQSAFVLLPLSEIAADLVHPETGQTIFAMWQNFEAKDQEIQKIKFDF